MADDKGYYCNYCQMEIISSDEYVAHMEKHYALPFSCKYCTMCFTSRKKLEAHKVSVHDIHDLVCPVCKYTFTNPSNYTTHVRRAQCIPPNNGDNYLCKNCNQTFHYFNAYDEHKRKCLHKKMRCHKCAKLFHLESSFEIHMKQAHCGSSPQCDKCGKKFKKLKYLYQHSTGCN